jgi:tRNA threonylcarbamoyladenosine biosynthesis protein TsaE
VNSPSNTVLSRSAADTISLGRALAERLPSASTILLIGNLGAGKTTFVKGLAEGLGVARQEDVSSPTFSLIHEYGDPLRLYHLDLYRLETPAEVLGIGIEELLDSGKHLVIEWGERFPHLWPQNTIRIEFSTRSETDRELRFTGLDGSPPTLHPSLPLPKG